MEIWKTIENHPKYEVSNLGRIRRIENGNILNGGVTQKGGYLRVNLDGKLRRVNILVAKAFIPNPKSNTHNQVHHIDNNKLNNTLSNLMWCDNDYNNDSSRKNKKKISIPFTDDEIIFILQNKGIMTAPIIAKQLGKEIDAISKVWRGVGKNNNNLRIQYLSNNPHKMELFEINEYDMSMIDLMMKTF